MLALRLILTFVLPLALGAVVSAQKADDLFKQFGDPSPDLKIGAASHEDARFEAELMPAKGKDHIAWGDTITLKLTARVPDGWYTYPINGTSNFRNAINDLKVTGLTAVDDRFRPDRKPKKSFSEAAGEEVEKFESDITWIRRYKVTADTKMSSIKVTAEVAWQVCSGMQCVGKDTEINLTAKIGKPVRHFFSARPKQRKDKDGPITVIAQLSPAVVVPEQKVTLTVTLKMEKGWHIYSLDPQPCGLLATVLDLDEKALRNLVPIGKEFQPVRDAETIVDTDLEITTTQYLKDISFTREFIYRPKKNGPAGFGLKGGVKYQTCDDQQCLNPQDIRFELGSTNQLSVLAAPSKPVVAKNKPTRTDDKGKSAAKLPQGEKEWAGFWDDYFEGRQSDIKESSGIGLWLLWAFLGGVILNVMPCVLPVITIKIMGFIHQSEEKRGRVLALNLAYTLGVLAVFLTLASLAAFASWKSGEIFQQPAFLIGMACLMLAMGLSLLGVFEIPVPGFVGAGAGVQKEGLPGAFLTGIFTTLLATPCLGPFLGPTLGWSASQPPATIYLIWGTVGLGLAFPYVMCGLFPALVKFLPKPGKWMLHFKHVAGFILLAVVAWFVSLVDVANLGSLMLALLATAIAVWMIGQLFTMADSARKKNVVRVSALAVFLLIAGAGFVFKSDSVLPWESFSSKKLHEELVVKKRVVLVDFTADWCLTCKANEKYAMNQAETLHFVEGHNIATLKADFTKRDPAIKAWLDRFKSAGVPLCVLFPNDGSDPIIIRDTFTKSHLLEKLREAVGRK